MFGNQARASQAYRRVAVDSAALGGNQHQLVALMYSTTLASIAQARQAIANGDVAAKHAACTKAMLIVSEGLMGVVNRGAGPLADQLHALYAYCSRRLMQANAANDAAALEEVARLIDEVATAWRQIGQQAEPSPLAA